MIRADASGVVTDVQHVTDIGLRINGGFFVLNQRVFDYVRPGEDLMDEPVQRMIADRQMRAHPYDGFWACMDTFKEKKLLEDIYNAGVAPWEVWGDRRVTGDGARHGHDSDASVLPPVLADDL